MEKTDAELIAEVEGWKAEGDVVASFADAIRRMKELARRLKAANSERDEFREKYYQMLDACNMAREMEYLSPVTKDD